MAELIAITYEGREEANDVRNALTSMSEAKLIDLEDAAVAYKDQNGELQLDQELDETAAGALYGGFWGVLLGLLFSIGTGGALAPLVAGAFGASFGALSARLSDFGINEELMRQLASDIDDGKATLFVLARNVTYDELMPRLGRHAGKVLSTSLPEAAEAELRRWLHDAA